MRQPILLAAPRMLVSVSPQEGFLHQRTPLDTLGFDEPEIQLSPGVAAQQAPTEGIRCTSTCASWPRPRPCSWRSARAAEARTIYVSNEQGNSVSIVDGDRLELVKEVEVGERPRGIVLQPRRQVPVHLRERRRHGPDPGHRDAWRSSATLPSGPDPEVIVISPDGAKIYAANEDDNLVTVIDVASRSVATEIPVGVEPEGMGISPDGKTIVNTSETTNMAHFIDAATHEITAQRAGRPAAAGRRVHGRRRRGLGDLGDRRHGRA